MGKKLHNHDIVYFKRCLNFPLKLSGCSFCSTSRKHELFTCAALNNTAWNRTIGFCICKSNSNRPCYGQLWQYFLSARWQVKPWTTPERRARVACSIAGHMSYSCDMKIMLLQVYHCIIRRGVLYAYTCSCLPLCLFRSKFSRNVLNMQDSIVIADNHTTLPTHKYIQRCQTEIAIVLVPFLLRSAW